MLASGGINVFNRFMSDIERSFEEEFAELIDANGSQDIGIVQFEQRMAKEQEDLTEHFAGKVGLDMDSVQVIENSLNEDWPYHDDIATVTGRIYLVESDMREILPEEWGETTEDEEGNEYFYLEEVRLRSHGVEVVPFFDDKGKTTMLKPAFVFSYEEDDIEHPILNAYVSELAVHQYEIPTAAEASRRLERDWPDQAKLIEQLMHPDLQMALPGRLSHLSRRLQRDLSQSDYFKSMVELTVNDYLSLDIELPYATTIQGEIKSFDGENPNNPEDPGSWMNILFNGDVNTFVYEPHVYFSKNDDGEVFAYILGKTYNNEDGDDPEYISMKAEDTKAFRSTRTMRSILSRALMGMEGSELLADNFSNTQAFAAATGQTNGMIDAKKIRVEGLNKQRREPLLIREMGMLQSELDELKKIIREAQKTIYATSEEATEAAKDLIEQVVGPRLVQGGLGNGYELEFSGMSAIRPRHAKDLPDLSDKPHLFVFGIDVNEPFVPLQDGDSFRGIANSVQPFALELTDEDNSVTGYKVYPSIVADISTQKQSALTWQSVSMLDLNIETRAVAPLDGSADIRVRQLDRYNNSIERLQKIAREYRGTTVARQLNRLHRALQTEHQSEFQILKQVNLLAGLDNKIVKAREEGRNVGMLVTTLESMLVERKVGIYGEMIDRDGNVIPDANGQTGIAMRGQILDVRDDVKEGVVIVIKEEGDVKYVPLRSIKGFSF